MYLYLLGVFSRDRVRLRKGRVISAVASVALAVYCLFGARTGELGYLMTAIAPPYPFSESVFGSGETELAKHVIIPDDYDAAVAEAIQDDKLVLINFTGHT